MWFGLSLLLTGISLCAIFYVILSPGLKTVQEKPTISLRRLAWVWPWVTVSSTVVMPFLSWTYQRKLQHNIELAGYKGDVSTKDIAGLQGLCSIVVGVLGVLSILNMINNYFGLLGVLLLSMVLGFQLPLVFLQRKARERKQSILKVFPFFLDMTTLCVESGLNLHGALLQASQALPDSPLRQELRHTLNDMRTGVNRMEALKGLSQRIGLNEVKQWVSSLIQADKLGMSLGPVLRTQADQFRGERFLRAEKKAATAPVKMLFPLVLFIFPCTFIVIAFPLVSQISDIGFF
ncbi:type II secretion system F family protein [Pelistega sp. NLN82]|uniref:Type II secretion system F family protein n=1 Tax=Pelistega ratti TaxID=2652177 RepID=A0A6L9Y425_9BURK|nr:type II secretion system F family protein [Pelistega ratti]NEN75200.1 type II secretion system F family protein [Pelistega ratti]